MKKQLKDLKAKLIVGVDIGKHFHQATVINETGQILGGSIRFPNSVKGADLLLTRVASVNHDNLSLVFGLEATGHYWLALYSFLIEKDYRVYVINPYQSNAWRKVYLSTTKTDKEDSFLIADILRFGSFSETKLASEQMINLRNLTRFRISLNQQMTDTKRRIITILDQIFPEFEELFSNTFGKTAKAILKDYPTPQELDTLSIKKLAKLISRFSKGRFKEQKALEIKDAATNSFGVTFSLDSFTLQLKLLMEQLEFLEKQLGIIDYEIANIMNCVNSVLVSLPGVGILLAANIHAEIGDIKRFKTSSQLASFAGIDPTVRQSGDFTGSKNKMSKKGSPYLRLALWQAAVTSVRFNPVLKEYYEQKLTEGKHHMTALGAVAMKLTRIIFAMLTKQKEFIV